jgi:Contractile injection system tube protein
MPDGPLTKAKIHTIEGGHIEVECLFNPKEYQIQRSNNWGPADNSTKNASDLTFSGSSGAKLSLQLFFDTYMRSPSSGATTQRIQDVRVHTDKLWQMMNIQDKLRDPKTHKGRPPRVLFSWGKNWLFNAVITTMQQQYTLFTPTGMPVRAMVTVEFQESLEHPSLMAASNGSETISAKLRAHASDYAGDIRQKYGR